MADGTKKLTRREALLKLGIGFGAAYCAPAVTGLSQARASTTPSEPSEPSEPTPPTPPSKPTAPTAPSGPSSSEDLDADGNPTVKSNGTCRTFSAPSRPSMSRRDMKRAQAAVADGKALPVRDIIKSIQKEHPGRLIKIRYALEGSKPVYRLQMVSNSGALQTVTVFAGSGVVSHVSGC